MISDKIINYLFICNTAAGLNIVSIDTVSSNSIKLEQAQSILSIYKLCLSVCSFVCLYPINVKTGKPIGPKFCVGPHVIPGPGKEFMNDQNFKNLNQKKNVDIYFLKMAIFRATIIEAKSI